MKLATVAFAFLCMCCVKCSTSHEGRMGDDPAPVIRPQPSELCPKACYRFEELGCEEGTPVPLEDGSMLSCAEFCVYEHANGVAWNLSCLTAITSCEEIESVCNPSSTTQGWRRYGFRVR